MNQADRAKLERWIESHFESLGDQTTDTAEALTRQLIAEGWPARGLRLKLSNLLRLLANSKPWLVRVRNGEYRYVEVTRE